MKLDTIEKTTYIRADDGTMMATFDEATAVIEIKRNRIAVEVDLEKLLKKFGLRIVPDVQEFDNSE